MKKYLLRSLVLSCVLCLMSFVSHAQSVLIPDTNFVNWLSNPNNGFDWCIGGGYLNTSCAAVVNATELSFYNAQITNFEGIQYFPNVKRITTNGAGPGMTVIPAFPPALRYLSITAHNMDTLPPFPATMDTIILNGLLNVKYLTLPASVTYLQSTQLALRQFPVLPAGLVHLEISNNNFGSVPVPSSLPAGLKYFDCNTVNWTSLPPLPNGLELLNCMSNNIGALPVLPDSLRELWAPYCHLTNLPYPLPQGLRRLFIYNNSLTSLGVLPSKIYRIDANNNLLASIASPLPDSLYYFACSYNQLTSLPAYPGVLGIFGCYSNNITSLPAFNDSMRNFSCGSNPITSMPVPNNGLVQMECSYTPQLTTIPSLPASLTSLTCNNSSLTSLPALPNGLVTLKCGHNQLTQLPALPNSLSSLYCQANQLTSLPDLPNIMSNLNCDTNANLYCLPKLKKISTLRFLNTGISCKPNFGIVSTSTPPLNTIPLCDVINPGQCAVAWNIAGNIYLDANSNCHKDAGEDERPNVKVDLYQGGSLLEQTYSNNDGDYSFQTTVNGIYQVQIDSSNLPLSVLCPAARLYNDTITTNDPFDSLRNFSLVCKPGFDLEALSIGGRFRPGTVTTVSVAAGDIAQLYNANCAQGISGTVTVTFAGPVTYVSPAAGAIAPASVSGNTLTWNIADFGNVSFDSSFNFMLQTNNSASINDEVCFTASISPTAGDNNPQNNVLQTCLRVRNSFDPNEKEVSPAAAIDATQKWLTYTIHFQNTGTDTALQIYVTDTLDSNLDAGSFQLLKYSNQPLVEITGSKVRFNFLNINLPDSNTNEAASHGYVQYRVKLKDNLPLGTTISNTAFIYFDFNAPVVTNTTSNTISNVTAVSDFGMRNADFGLNPNPATESVRISIDESMVGSNLTITDLAGREVLHSAVQIRNPQFDIRNLSPGVYFINLENKTGRVTKKLVKQ